MSEAEKQEGQKTVVAFITGLLIGGLLVWVFSSTPETQAPAESGDEAKTEQTDDAATTDGDTKPAEITIKKDDTKQAVVVKEEVGEGTIEVKDQSAGKTVTLDEVIYPTKNGWVVVRDYMDGVPGNVLGAARYSTTEGLLPKQVDLLRETQKDSSYQVVFFTESGDKSFSLKDDTLIDSAPATFKAK